MDDPGPSRHLALACGLVLYAACAGSSTTEAGSRTVGPGARRAAIEGRDRALEAEVHAVFARDPQLVAETLDVTAVRAIVALEGAARTLLTEQRALADAKLVPGVGAVIERVRLLRSVVADPELARSVRRALAVDPVTAPYAIDVDVRDARADLSGKVGSWQALRVARDIAAATVGVTRVRVRLEVDPVLDRTDENLRAEVESRLRGDIRIDPRLVGVRVVDGTVDLTGDVDDERARALVIEDAWGVGVRRVRARLRLIFEGRTRFTDGTWPIDDATIRARLLDAFEQDERLRGARPAVAVREGVVDLVGVVPDALARDAAEADAENTLGVVDVRDDLGIHAAELLPDVPVERVTAALRLDLDAERLRVADGGRGVVVLEGEVASDRAHVEAIRIARHVPGVNTVKDAVHVVPSPGTDRDAVLLAEVQAALGAASGVPVTRIRASASEGVVTLDGSVSSASEAYAAIRAAYRAGAREVHSQIALAP